MTSDHPGEHTLSLYMLDPSLVADRTNIDAHLASCTACAERLEEIRSFDALLAEEDSWPDSDEPEPLLAQSLRETAARMEREDEEAEALLAPLLAGPAAAFVWADVASRPEFHTGGMVRKLAAAADTAWYTAPRHALNFAETAIAIAGMLNDGPYQETELAGLRGVAWKQRANALRHLGRHREALESLDRAARYFRELSRPELDLASLAFIRGEIHCEQHDYERATQNAEECAVAFGHLGQTKLFLRARYLIACIAFEERKFAQAEELFQTLHAYGELEDEPSWTAIQALALGNCALERLDVDRATYFLHKAMLRFRELGMSAEEIRCRWGFALVASRSGRHRAAVSRLREVRDEFLLLGATTDAALVTLDLIETFLAAGKAREAQRAAGNVVTIFREAGMLTGALTAAGFLKQAAAMQIVTPTIIDYVRRYLRRVEAQPDLTFAPPAL